MPVPHAPYLFPARDQKARADGVNSRFGVRRVGAAGASARALGGSGGKKRRARPCPLGRAESRLLSGVCTTRRPIALDIGARMGVGGT